MSKLRHYEKSAIIHASPEKIFDFVDDHSRFSSHMNKSSWMMGGGKMNVETDEEKGQKVGSHIKMEGRVFGIKLFLDEVVIEHQSTTRKVWKTVGNIRLLVIGHYQIGIEISPQNDKSSLKVFIDYNLPSGIAWFLGYLFGGMYAKWCVKQMLSGVENNFM